MTIRILRERQRPLWRRAGVLVPVALVIAALGVGAGLWHLGGPVAVRPIAVALPDTEVSVASTGAGE